MVTNTQSQQQVAVPSTSQPLVNIPAGTITYPWYRFFINLYNRGTDNNTVQENLVPEFVEETQGVTLTGKQMNTACILRLNLLPGFIDTFDTAQNYISAKNQPVAPSVTSCLLINQSSSPWSITSPNGVDLYGNLIGGTYQIPANSQRTLIIEITSISNPRLSLYL